MKICIRSVAKSWLSLGTGDGKVPYWKRKQEEDAKKKAVDANLNFGSFRAIFLQKWYENRSNRLKFCDFSLLGSGSRSRPQEGGRRRGGKKRSRQNSLLEEARGRVKKASWGEKS
jgi:hypothetical protein